MIQPHSQFDSVKDTGTANQPVERRSASAASPFRPLFQHLYKFPKGLRYAALPIATGTLAFVTFIVDTVTHYEIAAATFYVVVVLLSSLFCQKRGVMLVSAACVVLTIVSYTLTKDGNFRTGIINTSISLIAIAATSYLAVRMQAARAIAERTQARLARVARVTALAEIAASIAHEVNQPLAAIVTNAQACGRWIHAHPANVDKASTSIDSIVDDATRASEIINRVRALAMRTEPKKSWVDVRSVIHEVIALMQTQIRENRITLRIDLADHLPMIFADHIQLQQVILNLIVNAIDAINAATSESREIHVVGSSAGSSDVTVVVKDSGIGIDATSADRIFDAFYSTKNEGMGMGLSICRSIIEAHGGHIGVVPNRSRGAAFRFTIPTSWSR